MRRRNFYKQDDGKMKTSILRKAQDRETKSEQVEAFRRFECRKCGKIVPRGLYMHEKHCKGP